MLASSVNVQFKVGQINGYGTSAVSGPVVFPLTSALEVWSGAEAYASVIVKVCFQTIGAKVMIGV